MLRRPAFLSAYIINLVRLSGNDPIADVCCKAGCVTSSRPMPVIQTAFLTA